MNLFSEQEEEKLINIVFAHPVLYDISHEHFRNHLVKQKAWKAVAKELNKNCAECKKKWKGIRDGYHRFKRKHTLGSAAPKQSKDRRHVLLSFLDNVPHNRWVASTFSSSPTVQNIEESLDPLSSNEQDEQVQEHSNDEASCTEEESDIEEITEVHVPNEAENIKRNKKDAIATVWDKNIKKRQSVPLKTEDDIDLFVRHIGKVLRTLPQVEKAQAKKHLHEVLSDYEIMAAKNLQPQSTSSRNAKRKINEHTNKVFENIQSSKRKMDQSKDEFDIYGQNVASELRLVKHENAVLKAKSLINNILIDTRMNKYNNFGRETCTTSTQELKLEIESDTLLESLETNFSS